MRIVSNNVADNATIAITPSPVAGMDVGNLKTENKHEICRVADNAATITVTLDKVQETGCVAFPSCNLSSRAKMRVRVYDELIGGDERHDSGFVYVAPGVNQWSWNPSQNLNINVFGDYPATVAMWHKHVATGRIVIDIEDELISHIDISRLVIGRYWEPIYCPAYGLSWGMDDSTTNTRSESGNIITDGGNSHRIFRLPMDAVDKRDRHRVTGLLRQGIGKRHFISVTPDNKNDVGFEQDFMMYGVLSNPGDIAYFAPGMHQTQFVFEEW